MAVSKLHDSCCYGEFANGRYCVGLSGLLQREWCVDRGSMSHGSHCVSPSGLRSRSLGSMSDGCHLPIPTTWSLAKRCVGGTYQVRTVVIVSAFQAFSSREAIRPWLNEPRQSLCQPSGLRKPKPRLDERWLPPAYPDNLFASKTLRGWDVSNESKTAVRNSCGIKASPSPPGLLSPRRGEEG